MAENELGRFTSWLAMRSHESRLQRLRDAAMLMLDTGLRLGKVLALEWQDVHLDREEGHCAFGRSKTSTSG